MFAGSFPKQTTLPYLALLIPVYPSGARNVPALSWEWSFSGLGGSLQVIPSP